MFACFSESSKLLRVKTYQELDKFINYQIYFLQGDNKNPLRGPKPNFKQPYFACLGAAQTYGRFTQKPFAHLLSKKLGLQSINLASGGINPESYIKFFQNRVEVANKAKFVIIQIMSARAISNSKYQHQLHTPAKKVWEKAFKNQNINKLISETRTNYITYSCKLLNDIKVPKILMWFSTRKPAYVQDYISLNKVFGKFPQLVNQEIVNSIIPLADLYSEIITSKGLPQRLPGGKKNTYYPSPEMHEIVAGVLYEQIKQAGFVQGDLSIP